MKTKENSHDIIWRCFCLQPNHRLYENQCCLRSSGKRFGYKRKKQPYALYLIKDQKYPIFNLGCGDLPYTVSRVLIFANESHKAFKNFDSFAGSWCLNSHYFWLGDEKEWCWIECSRLDFHLENRIWKARKTNETSTKGLEMVHNSNKCFLFLQWLSHFWSLPRVFFCLLWASRRLLLRMCWSPMSSPSTWQHISQQGSFSDHSGTTTDCQEAPVPVQ